MSNSPNMRGLVPASVFALAVAVSGWSWFRSPIAGVRGGLTEAADPERPSEVIAAEIQVEIEGRRNELAAAQADVELIAAKAEASASEAGLASAERVAHLTALAKEQRLLDNDAGETIALGLLRYSRSQLLADARARMSECDRKRVTAEIAQSTADSLRMQVEQGRKDIERARVELLLRESELQRRMSALENTGLQVRVSEITATLRGSPLSRQTSLSRDLDLLSQMAAILRAQTPTAASGSERFLDLDDLARPDGAADLRAFLKQNTD